MFKINLISRSYLSLVEFHELEIGQSVIVSGYNTPLTSPPVPAILGEGKIKKISYSGEQLKIDLNGKEVVCSPAVVKRQSQPITPGDFLLTRNNEKAIAIKKIENKKSLFTPFDRRKRDVKPRESGPKNSRLEKLS